MFQPSSRILTTECGAGLTWESGLIRWGDRVVLPLCAAPMPKVNTESYMRYLEELELVIHARQPRRLCPYDPAEDCLVTNLSRLPTNRLDFGSGTPDYVLPLMIGRNSAAVLGDGNRFALRVEHRRNGDRVTPPLVSSRPPPAGVERATEASPRLRRLTKKRRLLRWRHGDCASSGGV